MTVLEEVELKAMQLPSSERGHLIHDLLKSLDPPTGDFDDYENEIQHRIAQIKAGSVNGIMADEVFKSIENKYS